MELDLELRAVAERQHSVIARRQARALGATSEHLRRRVESPDWESLTSRVLRLVGAQRTFRQRCHPGRTERALDNALARGLTTVSALRQVTDELARQGRPGSSVMRRLLADRAGAYVPPESQLEARFHAVAKQAGLELVRQCDVGGDHWIGRVDFLDPRRRLVVEVDSDLHHTSLLDEAADAERDAAMAEAGYTVVRITEHDVWHCPDEVVRRLLAS
jgi:very-short-patch-repair endonuclease